MNRKVQVISLMIFCVLLVLCSLSVNGQSIEGASAQGSASTSDNEFSDVTGASITLDVTGVDHVMIVTSFQVRMTAPESSERQASFRIVDSADPENINSGIIRRSLSNAKSTDYGIGSLVHIFDVSACSGNRTYKFQHAFDANSRTLYTDATLVGLELKCGTEQMLCSEARMESPLQMTTSWADIPETETPVISTSIWGGFYVAASVENQTTSFNTASSADWKLQYKKGSGGAWTDMGPVVSHSMSDATDIGIVSLVGVLPNKSSPGDYYFRITHRKTSLSSTVQTCSGNIIAVFLGAGETYFEVFGEQVPSVQTNSSTYSDVVTYSVAPETTSTNMYLHAQYSMTCNAETNAPRFDLYVDNSIFDGYDMYRYISDSVETGAGVNIGLAKGLTDGTTYNTSLRHASASGNTLTTSGLFLGGFYLSGEENTLPVELFHFDAKNEEGIGNSLVWVTYSEINNDYFTIFRSIDCQNWVEIACVAGAGCSHVQKQYQYCDKEVPRGTVYYKLSQTDENGNSEELGVVSVESAECAPACSMKVYPNPAHDKLFFACPAGYCQNRKARIFETDGSLNREIFLHGESIDISGLTSGRYTLLVEGFYPLTFIVR